MDQNDLLGDIDLYGSTVAHRPEVKGSTPARCVWSGAEGYRK